MSCRYKPKMPLHSTVLVHWEVTGGFSNELLHHFRGIFCVFPLPL